MIIIATAEMGTGTFEAKFIPISQCNVVKSIYVIRKSSGPKINKVNYIIIPKIFQNKLLGLFVRPILLIHYTFKLNANLILSYHFIPHAFFAFIASLITKKPFIIGQTGLYIQRDFSRKKIFSLIIKRVIKSSFCLNVPGQKSLDFWGENKIPTEKINLLHSTIDTNSFKPNNNPNKKYDFIILSRLAEEKRIDIIVELLSQLNKKGYTFKTVIVGEGDRLDSLKKQVETENLNDCVKFVGFQEETTKWFNQAKYYLMFSESEGLPTSLMQAMACGLVPIVTDVGNISEIVDGNVGFIHDFSDKNGYLNSMEFAVSGLNKNDFERYSKQCRYRIVQNHCYQVAKEKWADIFKML